MSRLEKLQRQLHVANKRLNGLYLKIANEAGRRKRQEDNRKNELERIKQAHEMRRDGHTHAEIAAVMGYSRSRAQAVTKGIKCKKKHKHHC